MPTRPVHLARELGAWDIALAAPLLLVVLRPSRAVGLVPFAAALALAMVGAALIDLVSGRAAVLGETQHLLELAGLGLLWVIAHRPPDDSPLLDGFRRPRPTSPPDAAPVPRGRLARLAALLGLVALFVVLPARPGLGPRRAVDQRPGRRVRWSTRHPTRSPSSSPRGSRSSPTASGCSTPRATGSTPGAPPPSGDTVTAPVDGFAGRRWLRGGLAGGVGRRPPDPGCLLVLGRGSGPSCASGLADEAFAGERRPAATTSPGAVLRFLGYVGVLGATGAVLVGAALRRDDEPSPVSRVATVLAGARAWCALVLQLPVQASLATGQGWGSITDERGAGADAVRRGRVVDRHHRRGPGGPDDHHRAPVPGRGPGAGAGRRRPGAAGLRGHRPHPHDVAGGGGLPRRRGPRAGRRGLVRWARSRSLAVRAPRRRRDDAAGRGRGRGPLLRVGGGVGGRRGRDRVTSWAGSRSVGSTPSPPPTYGRLLMVKVALVALVAGGRGLEPVPPGRRRRRARPADPVPDAGPPTPRRARSRPSSRARGAGATAPDRRPRRPGLGPAPPGRALRGGGAGGRAGHHGGPGQRHPGQGRRRRGLRTVSAPLGDGTVEVVVDPASARSQRRPRLPARCRGPARRLLRRRRPSSWPCRRQDIGPLDREPVRAGPGHFQLVGTDLDLAGEWTLTVTVKPDRFTEQTATVTFRVQQPAGRGAACSAPRRRPAGQPRGRRAGW